MRKFLKVFIIVLLVIASIVGTCYFFFSNLKKKNNTTASFAEILFSESNQEFDADLYKMSFYVNGDGTDDRVDLIVETNDQLQEVWIVLSTYFVENDTKINHEKISKALNQYASAKNLLNNMMQEYTIKKDSIYFDRHLGANDFYNQSCNYLVKFAKLLNLINANLKINKNADFKFSMFDVYTNLVINTFSSIKQEIYLVVEDEQTISNINNIMLIDNGIITTDVEPFAKEINQFNELYHSCNKGEFSKNLGSNLQTVTNENQTTNEKLATYYFKRILGI